MSTQTFQTASSPGNVLPDMPIDPSWITEGNPIARGTVTTQSADKKVSSGLWSCEVGKFEWTFSWDEFIHILAGEVDITEEETGKKVTLRPGDMAHFPQGMKVHWHVKQSVRKFFVIRTPEAFEL
ncbi:MAG: cupin domain-containing protein [Pirellulaceae bacterium]|nr:cupin domain-containing protein [Pirellulaceae bacterium]